ncbi:DUF998 domain-containing protein [Domibacillus sp. PGB-M46]|uniref:DUF998 domain-containing protein n=1 Tax=Domibacillus sp. PGB-M46 TaxID=2910255 RepID=UPI001F59F082|nr:DUF998 domain-containing protein [Domibacillus sp. PGB-M46]MCI2256172.1 DUF998 domain-containing protein [Domibacillus sp. PGB-M46]
MDPHTVVSFLLFIGVTISASLLSLLFPRKIRRTLLIITGVTFIAGIGFFAIRPHVAEHQTVEAILELENHLKEKYLEDSWRITDTDEYRIQSEVILHVRFNSEQNVIYEYSVNDKSVKQINFWAASGDTVDTNRINPQHFEP